MAMWPFSSAASIGLMLIYWLLLSLLFTLAQNPQT